MERGKWAKAGTFRELALEYATRLMNAEAKYLVNGSKEGPVPFESLQRLAKDKVIFDDERDDCPEHRREVPRETANHCVLRSKKTSSAYLGNIQTRPFHGVVLS